MMAIFGCPAKFIAMLWLIHDGIALLETDSCELALTKAAFKEHRIIHEHIYSYIQDLSKLRDEQRTWSTLDGIEEDCFFDIESHKTGFIINHP